MAIITVEIKCRHMVEYVQSVQMEESEYEALKAIDGGSVTRGTPLFGAMQSKLDMDVFSSEDEFTNISITKAG